jgi:uncharacterized low-complexity protein
MKKFLEIPHSPRKSLSTRKKVSMETYFRRKLISTELAKLRTEKNPEGNCSEGKCGFSLGIYSWARVAGCWPAL